MARSVAVWTILVWPAASSSLSSAAELQGIVREDHSEAAVASARVRVRSSTGEIVADRDTDRDGRFQTPALDAGPYRVEVSKANYLDAWRWVQLTASQPVGIRLVRLGVITGRVLDGANRPIPRAFVLPLARRGAGLQPLAPTQSDETGEYRLHGLAPGEYAVGVSRSKYPDGEGAGAMLYPSNAEPHFFEISGGEEHRNIDFILAAAAVHRVSGRLAGAPDGTTFAIGMADREQPLLSAVVAKSDQNGEFALEGVQPGSYWLFASGPVNGYGWYEAVLGDAPLFARVQVDVGGHDVTGLTISVEPPRTGTLTLALETPDASRHCPTRTTVSLTPMEAWGARTAKGAQVEVGSPTQVEGLAPAPYRVTARSLPTGCFQDGDAILDAASERPRSELKLTSAGEIHGRFTAAARGADLVVALVPLDPFDDAALWIVAPEEDGSFRFNAVRPGRYRIASGPAGHGAGNRFPAETDPMFDVEVTGGTTTEIELPAPASR